MARTKSNEVSLKKAVSLALKGKDLATGLKITKKQADIIQSQKVFVDALAKAKEEAAKIVFFLVDDYSEKGDKIELEVKGSAPGTLKRGRKPKAEALKAAEKKTVTTGLKKRGRKPKAETLKAAEKKTITTGLKKRGRKPKAETLKAAEKKTVTTGLKKRGRKPKAKPETSNVG